MKRGTVLKYIHRVSDHPPSIIRAIPKGVNNRLSSSEAIFNTAAPPYQEALGKAGYSHKLVYNSPSTLLLMSHPNRGFLAPKWVTHHFWEIHICGAAPLSINAILPICEGLVAARMTLCAVVNTSHPHIPETHQESRMKAFVG